MQIEVSLVFRFLDLGGVLLNGILGGAIARHKHFDAVGFAFLAILSALGGGVIRDVMLQSGRPVALADPAYLSCALIGAGIVFVWQIRGAIWEWFYPLADSLVLGAWAATGTYKALASGVSWLPALFLGLLSAVGGGMIRDVAVGRVPAVFGGNNLYATPALLSAGVVSAGVALGAPSDALLIAATLLGAALAGVSHRFGWTLPRHGDGTMTALRNRMRPRPGGAGLRRPRPGRAGGSARPTERDNDGPSRDA